MTSGIAAPILLAMMAGEQQIRDMVRVIRNYARGVEMRPFLESWPSIEWHQCARMLGYDACPQWVKATVIERLKREDEQGGARGVAA